MDFALALTRHGEYAQPANVPSAHLPHPLVELGRKQARDHSDALRYTAEQRGWQICDVIDSSPLLRAWETATIFAERLGLRVDTFDDLTERSLGSAANLTMDEIAAVIERDPRFDPLPEGWKRDSEFRLPLVGAESLRDAGARVARHLERRRAETQVPGGDGLYLKIVIGHGGAIRHAAVELGMLESADVDALSMFHAQPVIYAWRNGCYEHITGDWKQRYAASEDRD